ncbi:hypothetical protein AB3N60_04290 [Leptospira sp. WS39.C2]
MKFRSKYLFLFLVPSILFTFSCKSSQIKNYESKGNLASSYSLKCSTISELFNYYTPADIFPAVRDCIEKGEYENASYLQAAAGVYGRYDTLRVEDRSAHQAIRVLQINILGTIEQEKLKAYQEYFQTNVMTSNEKLLYVCQSMNALGKPTYTPNYMIAHGISSFSDKDHWMVKNFDPEKAWNSAIDSYLHCPK